MNTNYEYAAQTWIDGLSRWYTMGRYQNRKDAESHVQGVASHLQARGFPASVKPDKVVIVFN